MLDGVSGNKTLRLTKRYITSAKQGDDMKSYSVNNKPIGNPGDNVSLPARSITSFVFEQ